MAKHRLNLDLSPEELHELVETVELDGDGATQSSVTRRALKLYRLVLKKQKLGSKILFKNSDGSQETVFIL